MSTFFSVAASEQRAVGHDGEDHPVVEQERKVEDLKDKDVHALFFQKNLISKSKKN
jgi:hypothetical protein